MAVDLVAETATTCLVGGECLQRGNTGQGMIRVPGGTEQDGGDFITLLSMAQNVILTNSFFLEFSI